MLVIPERVAPLSFPFRKGYIVSIFILMSFICSDLGYRNYDWDYRWMEYPPQAKELRHPGDHSVATYRGHSVLRTLIRCHFSPEYR